MRNLNEDWNVLDLTDSESKILWALIENGTMSVSKISRLAQVARTTVGSALKRLQDRKLVRRVSSKGHISLWRVARLDKVKNELLEVVAPFNRDSVKVKGQEIAGEIMGGIDAEEVGIKVFRGKQQILSAYEQILNLSKTERVWVIQGNKSAVRALNDFDKGYIQEFVKSFKKHKIIMEAVNGECVKELLRQTDKKTLKASFGRMIVSSLLHDKYMDFDVDLFIIRDSVMFFDMKNEIVVIIMNKPIVEMLKSISMFLKENGKKFDVNEYINSILEGNCKT